MIEDNDTQKQLKLSAVVAGVAMVAFLQQLYFLLNVTGGRLSLFSEETVSFLSVAVLFLTVFYLLLKQLKSMQSQIQLAFVDELTGLPNRREFLRLLDKQWDRRRLRGEKWCVCYLDLDKFKAINDSYGHDAGDAVIKAFGERISAVVRKSDSVARLSGDEFAIIMRDVEDDRAVRRVAEDILHAMRDPVCFKDRHIIVRTSIGACLADISIDSPSLLLSFADFALMQAKENGRNNLQLFNPGMAEELEMRGVLASELRESIQAASLTVIYQPLYTKNSDKPRGAEALLRWTHSKYGAISPTVFVPIAEEIGLVEDLTWFVLCKACLDIAPLNGITLSVNISSAHFVMPGFVRGLSQILTDTGFEAGRLELEINESVFATNREKAIATVKALREIGVQVALDDFGTGYSSLSYLKDVPLSRIKIDKSFMTEFESGDSSKELITSMIKLGRSLGLNVTVEGVESSKHLDFLNQSDCTEMQGYHLSKPITLKELSSSIGFNQRRETDRLSSTAQSWAA